MKFWKTIPFAAAVLAVQAQSPPKPSVPVAAVPLYRVTLVQGSTKAINYQNLKAMTEIDLKGTVLAPKASGVATVQIVNGAIQVTAKFKDLPAASTLGGEYLTYVLWGISPEGRPANLGELLLRNGRAKIKVSEKLQTFGLVVTAEPYFAVSQPSDAVVLENAVREGSQGQVALSDAKFQLLKRGQYNMNLGSTEPIVMDENTPFVVYQARNAMRIAHAAGASAYAPDAYEKAKDCLKQAEAGEGNKKAKLLLAREAVQRAEDARLIAVQRQDAERVILEKKVAQDNLDEAKRQAALAIAAEDEALRQSRLAESANQGLRSKNEGLQSRNTGLRSQLKEQLNAILETRATARGLIVSMSGVLFETSKAVLVPAAREKLAKIAGILSAHQGLAIEAGGFTDSTGSDEFNMRLSEARAKNAMEYLVSQGVPSDSITFKGYGKADPIATNDTPAGRQENRRVELVVSGEGLTPP